MTLVQDCLKTTKNQKKITGSVILKYCRNPFLVWCDVFAPKDQRDPKGKYLDLLFHRGIDHEQVVVDSVFKDAFKPKFDSLEHGFSQVIEACMTGTNTIASAPLFFGKENFRGIIDVLVKSTTHDSNFGDFHYVIKEIKSAKHMKREYILQAAFYNYLIGLIQGYTPTKFYLINRASEEFEFEYDQVKSDLFSTIKGIREIFAGKEISPTAKGVRWPWESYAIRRAVETGDVSVIPHVGHSLKMQLNKQKIFTVADLASATNQANIHDKTWARITRSAKSWISKKPILIQKPTLVTEDVELYLDFEGTDDLQTEEGMIKVDYLVGILVKENDKISYKSFIAKGLNEEEKMITQFVQWLESYKVCKIYHYGSYEKIHIKALGKKYNFDYETITKRMIDVLEILKKSVALPTMSMSLKEVGKFLNYKWRGMASAQDSIAMYLEYTNSKDDEVLQTIITYNEDDVRATKIVKDFLTSL